MPDRAVTAPPVRRRGRRASTWTLGASALVAALVWATFSTGGSRSDAVDAAGFGLLVVLCAAGWNVARRWLGNATALAALSVVLAVTGGVAAVSLPLCMAAAGEGPVRCGVGEASSWAAGGLVAPWVFAVPAWGAVIAYRVTVLGVQWAAARSPIVAATLAQIQAAVEVGRSRIAGR